VRQARTADELLAEARAIARLSHPNIVQVYDAGRLGERFFLAMEWVEGENLAQILSKRKLSLRGVIHAGRQICAALDHAHRRHIVHRDLKPSNLLWTPENRIKLTDFGLARALEESLNQVLTRPAGTPYYMAPEQIRGQAIDGRADLYALGCVLFEMLCNRLPFAGGGSSVYHHLNTAPEDPARVREDVPPALARLILGCLAKDPQQRPASASTVGKALAELTDVGVRSSQPEDDNNQEDHCDAPSPFAQGSCFRWHLRRYRRVAGLEPERGSSALRADLDLLGRFPGSARLFAAVDHHAGSRQLTSRPWSLGGRGPVLQI
jgi:serine/threonine protein kinase